MHKHSHEFTKEKEEEASFADRTASLHNVPLEDVLDVMEMVQRQRIITKAYLREKLRKSLAATQSFNCNEV